MAPKIGLGGGFTYAAETTLGTFATPSKSIGIEQVTLTPNPQYDEQDQLVAGQVAGRVEDHILTGMDATLQVQGKVKGAKFAGIFNTITGSTITPTGSTAKTFEFPFGLVAPSGAGVKALSSQFRFSDGSAGSFRGGQTTNLKLTAQVDQALKFQLDQYGMEVQAGSGAPAAATPSYTASEGFSFQGSTLTFDGGSVGSCVKGFDVDFVIPRLTGERCLNGSEFPLEAVSNDYLKVSGTITARWDSDAQIDAFRNATWRAAKLRCLSKSDLAGAPGTKGECTIDLANMLLTGFPINVGGPGALEVQIPFVAKVAGANPAGKITLVTLDTAA